MVLIIDQMRAIVQTGYGQTNHNIKSIKTQGPRGSLGPSYVQIKVMYTCINLTDCKLVMGHYKNVKKIKFPRTIGLNFSGIVVGLGNPDLPFDMQQRVYGNTNDINIGTCAEYIVIKYNGTNIQSIPNDKLSFAHCAAVPTSSQLAYGSLVERGKINEKTNLLILGGDTPAGLYAIQIAKIYKCRYIVATSPHEKKCKSLGATYVISPHTDFEKEIKGEAYKDVDARSQFGFERFDIVLDCIGGKESWLKSQNILKKKDEVNTDNGIYITLVGDSAPQLLDYDSDEDNNDDDIIKKQRKIIKQYNDENNNNKSEFCETIKYKDFMKQKAKECGRKILGYINKQPQYCVYNIKQTNSMISNINNWLDNGKLKAMIDKDAPYKIKNIHELIKKCMSGKNIGELVLKMHRDETQIGNQQDENQQQEEEEEEPWTLIQTDDYKINININNNNIDNNNNNIINNVDIDNQYPKKPQNQFFVDDKFIIKQKLDNNNNCKNNNINKSQDSNIYHKLLCLEDESDDLVKQPKSSEEKHFSESHEDKNESSDNNNNNKNESSDNSNDQSLDMTSKLILKHEEQIDI